MKNLAKRAWQSFESIRLSSVVEYNTAQNKKTRPRWFGRVFSVSVDLGVYSMIFYGLTYPIGLASSSFSPAMLFGSFPFYYMAAESILGRSVGKFFMGYKMAISPKSSARGYLPWRGVLRLVPGLNLLMMLSWRRVTLLDLMSFTRVRLSHLDPSTQDNKKTSASPTLANSPNQSVVKKRFGSPRGFDPRTLKR